MRKRLKLSTSLLVFAGLLFSQPSLAVVESIKVSTPKVPSDGDVGATASTQSIVQPQAEDVRAAEGSAEGSGSSANAQPSTSGTADSTVPTTAQDAKKLAKTCTDARDAANQACSNPNSTSGMGGADKAMMMTLLAAAASTGAQIAASKGSAMACMLGEGLATTLQGLTLLKGNACTKQINACQTVCNEVSSSESAAYTAANKKQPVDTALAGAADKGQRDSDSAVSSCKGYTQNSAMMALQMQQLMGNAAKMAQCAAATSSTAATAVATPSPVALATGTGDCSDPSVAATSTVCLCKANPSDPLCNGASSAAGTAAGGLATGGVGTPSLATESDPDGSPVDTTDTRQKGQTGTVAGQGGGGGGAGFGNSGGSPGMGAEGSGDGTGASGIDKNVITGASGSSGGGLSAAGGGGSGGGGPGRSGSGSGGGGGFNLSKFLPKNKFANRGLAGMTVPAQDGVTGPLGPTIWEKVHTRYEDKKSSLIQDR